MEKLIIVSGILIIYIIVKLYQKDYEEALSSLWSLIWPWLLLIISMVLAIIIFSEK